MMLNRSANERSHAALHRDRPPHRRQNRRQGLAQREDAAGRHIGALRALAGEVDRVYGRHITINATGAIAAVLGEIGIPQSVMRGVAVISRSAGLVGHILEERERPAARFIWETVESSIPYDRPDRAGGS
jgi:citrate synthase